MYKYSKELAKALGIEPKREVICGVDCEYEVPSLKFRCPCAEYVEKAVETYPSIDYSVTTQTLLDVLFTTEYPIMIEKDGEHYIISIYYGVALDYVCEDSNLNDALILAIIKLIDKIDKETAKRLFYV